MYNGNIPSENIREHSYCSIHVENFLSIKSIYCNFKKINIIIGPQASGKSTIIKLVHFFISTLSVSWRIFTINNQDFDFLKRFIATNFTSIFPSEYIRGEKFAIDFRYKDYIISIYEKNRKITVSFNDELRNLLLSIKKSDDLPLDDFVNDLFKLENPFPKNLFIPDNRSVFTSFVKDNIFKMISQGKRVKMDFFLKHFASRYEDYVNTTTHSINTNEFKNIFHGEYHKVDNDEFIIQNNKKIKLEYGSSGQQEVISLLLAMHAQKASKSTIVCIEEPEAHLFPSTQKLLIEHIIATYSKMKEGSQFLITTHSPYVLSTINNLIVAHEIAASSVANAQKVTNIINKRYWLSYDDVSCWYIDNGSIIDLMNNETRMININEIDKVSNNLLEEFDKLLEIAYGDDND